MFLIETKSMIYCFYMEFSSKSAVNQLMTLRNWVIGYYIVEYEQDGSDRAQYGSHLLKIWKKKLIRRE